jgi:mRNA interferase MazF
MNSFSCPFDVGDIVQALFPFTDGEGGKPRPVLIVLPPDAKQDFVVLAITGSGHHGHSLPIAQHDLSSGRLAKTSFVRTDKLYTLNAQAVLQSFGKAKPALVDKARKEMCAALGCR